MAKLRCVGPSSTPLLGTAAGEVKTQEVRDFAYPTPQPLGTQGMGKCSLRCEKAEAGISRPLGTQSSLRCQTEESRTKCWRSLGL